MMDSFTIQLYGQGSLASILGHRDDHGLNFDVFTGWSVHGPDERWRIQDQATNDGVPLSIDLTGNSFTIRGGKVSENDLKNFGDGESWMCFRDWNSGDGPRFVVDGRESSWRRRGGRGGGGGGR